MTASEPGGDGAQGHDPVHLASNLRPSPTSGSTAFTHLSDISAAGLTAAGAGSLSATTPPDHPGRWRVTSPLGSWEVDADRDGRLDFELPLSADPVTVTLEPVAVAGSSAPAPTSAATRAGTDRVAALPATGSRGALAPATLLLTLAVLGGRTATTGPERPRPRVQRTRRGVLALSRRRSTTTPAGAGAPTT